LAEQHGDGSEQNREACDEMNPANSQGRHHMKNEPDIVLVRRLFD
jgi:hypothetical protein